MNAVRDILLAGALLGNVLLSACVLTGGAPAIEFTSVPEAGPGGTTRVEPIRGRVRGARSGQRIVLFARSGIWWVQPASNRPFTDVQSDGSFSSTTHLGTEYAALLVGPDFRAAKTVDALPERGGNVLAVVSVKGRGTVAVPAATPSTPPAVPKTLHFSGYEWEVVQVPTDSGGVMHPNSPDNAWTDARGWLHLRVSRQGGEWAASEVSLTRSLGYGSYSFVIRSLPALEPGTVLRMFTWDPAEAGQNHREVDIELSRWGDPESKNAQFVIQPYYVPANVFRFESPAAAQKHSFQWEPGRVTFESARLTAPQGDLAQHVFTSGVPTPGGETVHINLYNYGKSRTQQKNGVEVVLEKFTYLP